MRGLILLLHAASRHHGSSNVLSRHQSQQRTSLPVCRERSTPPPRLGRPRKLAGSFIEKEEQIGDVRYDEDARRRRRADGDIREKGDGGYVDDGRVEDVDLYLTEQIPVEWSKRAETHRELWEQPEYKENVLAKRKRARTPRTRRIGRPKPPPLEESAQKRSDAIRLLRSDEDSWMQARLDAGAERRAQSNSTEALRQRQIKRAEVAAKRYATRKANAAAIAREGGAASETRSVAEVEAELLKMGAEGLSALTIVELKRLLRPLGLGLSGRKQQLVDRLAEQLFFLREARELRKRKRAPRQSK